jgi:hypothetical protein
MVIAHKNGDIASSVIMVAINSPTVPGIHISNRGKSHTREAMIMAMIRIPKRVILPM